MKIYISRLYKATLQNVKWGKPFKILHGINIDVRSPIDIVVEPIYVAPLTVWTAGGTLFIQFGLKGVLLIQRFKPFIQWMKPNGMELDEE